jgi:NADPH:quinone reductase-like Zn-dependent oxidoreductase
MAIAAIAGLFYLVFLMAPFVGAHAHVGGSGLMRAVRFRRYGGPDVLRIEDVETPTPTETQVLVRVHATTVSTAEMAMRKGEPFFARVISGLRKPRKPTTPGSELAGEVTATGPDVTRFAVGDRVVGSTGASLGANAEYVLFEQDGALAHLPDSVSYEEAAVVCDGGLTALPFLRDAGHITAGERVLVNGASGGVGSVAVPLAKHLGAHVTGVCSAGSLDLVRSLGADEVIDYRTTEFTAMDDNYDIVFDVVGNSSFGRCRDVLKPGGRYLRTVPSLGVLARMLWTSRIGSRRAVLMFAGLRKPADKAKDLAFLMDLLQSGAIRPVVGKRFGFEESVDAHRFVEGGAKQGSVVLTI